MLIQKTIEQNGVFTVTVDENINFKPEIHLDEIKEAFNTFKNNGALLANSFEDLLWLYQGDVYIKPFRLMFDIERFRELNLALRAYVIALIINKQAPNTVSLELRYLKRAIIETSGFSNISKLELMLDAISSQSRPEASRIARTIKLFSDFYHYPNSLKVIKICEKVPHAVHGSRELPNFQDVMTFDFYTNKFFSSNTPLEERGKFLPVWLWWRLTNILPMRPSEFCQLEYNCISKKKNGTYWLKFKRVKTPGNGNKVIIEDNDELNLDNEYSTIQIDEATYHLITDFKNNLLLLNITDTKYLLPHELYKLSLINQNRRKKENYERLDLFTFREILKNYQKRIISGQFNIRNCDEVRPGDTRHFAIINMFLQGFNPLSIQRMAGHNIINTQANYRNHALHYAESFVYHIAQTSLESKLKKKVGNRIFGVQRKMYDKGLILSDNDLIKLRPVEFGYCEDTSPDFPINCVEDCRGCESYYIFKPSINEFQEGVKWLINYSLDLKNKMQSTINTIFDINQRCDKFNEYTMNEELKTSAKKLGAFMNQKAIVDAKIMEVDEFGD